MNDPIAWMMIAALLVVVLFAVVLKILRWILLVEERLHEVKRTNVLLEQILQQQQPPIAELPPQPHTNNPLTQRRRNLSG